MLDPNSRFLKGSECSGVCVNTPYIPRTARNAKRDIQNSGDLDRYSYQIMTFKPVKDFSRIGMTEVGKHLSSVGTTCQLPPSPIPKSCKKRFS
jgi:hypothetical protein